MGFIPEWALGVGVIIIAVSVGRVLSRIFRASGRALPAAESEISELRQALDATQNRVAELEERVDFAERLLAKHRESDRLGSPPR